MAGSEKGKIMGGLPGFSAFDNPVVSFTETRNQREVPGGRKLANSLLPEPDSIFQSQWGCGAEGVKKESPTVRLQTLKAEKQRKSAGYSNPCNTFSKSETESHTVHFCFYIKKIQVSNIWSLKSYYLPL